MTHYENSKYTTFVAYSPELDIIFETVSKLELNCGTYYKMFNTVAGEHIVVVVLGPL